MTRSMTAPATGVRGGRLPSGLYLYESGVVGCPPVVFVHGGGPSARMWLAHMRRMAADFHCVAPDLPGFGHSRRLPSRSPAETADLLADLIADRVPAGRAHVVGISYGGAVVLSLLERHPDVVDRAIVDGAAVLSGPWDRGIVTLVMLVSPLVNTRLALAFLTLVGFRSLGQELQSAAPAAFRRAWREGFTATVSRQLVAAPCPTLFVAGGLEGTVRASDAALAELMPHAVARFVPRLRHAWFLWRPELHIRMVETWLTGDHLPLELRPEPASAVATARVQRLIASADALDRAAAVRRAAERPPAPSRAPR